MQFVHSLYADAPLDLEHNAHESSYLPIIAPLSFSELINQTNIHSQNNRYNNNFTMNIQKNKPTK